MLQREADASERVAATQLVTAANGVADVLAAFPPAFSAYSRDGWTGSLTSQIGSELSSEQRAAVWALFEANMRDVYDSDQQRWSPTEKRRELFHVRHMRHTVTRTPSSGTVQAPCCDGSGALQYATYKHRHDARVPLLQEDARYVLVTDAATQQLVAYTHFRYCRAVACCCIISGLRALTAAVPLCVIGSSAPLPPACGSVRLGRFEVEDNLLAQQEMDALRLPRCQAVLYCYELQLSEAMRRRGVGRRLMQLLELLVRCRDRLHRRGRGRSGGVLLRKSAAADCCRDGCKVRNYYTYRVPLACVHVQGSSSRSS